MKMRRINNSWGLAKKPKKQKRLMKVVYLKRVSALFLEHVNTSTT
jgi:hypothetical protein